MFFKSILHAMVPVKWQWSTRGDWPQVLEGEDAAAYDELLVRVSGGVKLTVCRPISAGSHRSGGAMIKRHWVRGYDQLPARSLSNVCQSWDSASKDGGENDWSVCTTWLHHEGNYYLMDILRGRFDYPTLKARAISCARGTFPGSRAAAFNVSRACPVGATEKRRLERVRGIEPSSSA